MNSRTDKPTCPECRYAITERAAIHEFDGKATREEADRMAKDERCEEHKPKPVQEVLI